jgi:hypothetical protein
MFADESNILIVDCVPEHMLMIAPREFVALLASYLMAVEEGNKHLIDSAKLLLDSWLASNSKQLAVIKNIGMGEEDAEREEETSSKRD